MYIQPQSGKTLVALQAKATKEFLKHNTCHVRLCTQHSVRAVSNLLSLICLEARAISAMEEFSFAKSSAVDYPVNVRMLVPAWINILSLY